MENKVNICFIANFYKTYVFHEIAKRLEKRGANVYWIVTKLNQYSFLKENYKHERILYINRSYARKEHESIDDFRLNELVYGDRVFKHELEIGLNFLKNVQMPIYDFIYQHKIRFIFGEITWAHELLIRRIVSKKTELKCLYLDCSVVRIPNKRFCFFMDETHYELLEFDEPYVTGEIIKIEKPFYLKVNDVIVKKNSSVKGRLGRIKRFLSGENIEKNDPNVITDKATRFLVSGREEYNRITYKRIETINFEEIENQNFVFFGFHKQPESSIDVSGRYYEDQSQNVINLWRLLPEGWKLVLKEHSNAIGDRSYRFYKKLLAFPGIVMVNEGTDSKLLIEKSQLVATVTGTIAYEAALMKKPAITFAKVYFNRINYCRYMPIHELIKYESLEILVNELNSVTDNRLEFSEYLIKNSFEGYISDHVSSPEVMDDMNIRRVCTAFEKLFKKYANPVRKGGRN